MQNPWLENIQQITINTYKVEPQQINKKNDFQKALEGPRGPPIGGLLVDDFQKALEGPRGPPIGGLPADPAAHPKLRGRVFCGIEFLGRNLRDELQQKIMRNVTWRVPKITKNRRK